MQPPSLMRIQVSLKLLNNFCSLEVVTCLVHSHSQSNCFSLEFSKYYSVIQNVSFDYCIKNDKLSNREPLSAPLLLNYFHFMHSFCLQIFINTLCVSGTVLGTRYIAVNKTGYIFFLMQLSMYQRQTDSNHLSIG